MESARLLHLLAYSRLLRVCHRSGVMCAPYRIQSGLWQSQLASEKTAPDQAAVLLFSGSQGNCAIRSVT